MQLTVIRATIALSGNLSTEMDLRNFQLAGVQMPALWTAASMTFQARPGLTNNVSSDDTLQEVYDDAGTAIALTVVQAHYVLFGASALLNAFKGVGYMKVRSGTAGAPVTQLQAVELLFLGYPLA